MLKRFWRVLLCSAAVGACAETEQYIYTPAVNANARADGVSAAHYPVPAEAPKGDVRVASFGLTQVEPVGGGPKSSVLHVRMIVANNADSQAWTFDTQNVRASIPGAVQLRPAFVNTDAGTPPTLIITQGQQRVVDLFFPAPAGMDRADRVPGFDVSWQIETSSGLIAQRTPFERQQIAPLYYGPDYAYSYYGYPYYYGGLSLSLGYAPYWWYNPFYPAYAFHYYRPFYFAHHYYPGGYYRFSGGRYYGGRPFMVAQPHGFYGPRGVPSMHGPGPGPSVHMAHPPGGHR
jgi:hypothetical protein